MSRSHCRMVKGFSLVELLVTISVIAIMAALLVPAVSGLIQSGQLNSTSNAIANELQVAQATSVSMNLPAEVWFLRAVDSHGVTRFRAFGTVLVRTDGTRSWVTAPSVIEDAVALLPSATFSNVLGNQTPSAIPPRHGFTDGVALRFYPSGRVMLHGTPSTPMTPSTPFVITLAPVQALDSTELPPNFATIQVEPANGRIRIFRP